MPLVARAGAAAVAAEEEEAAVAVTGGVDAGAGARIGVAGDPIAGAFVGICGVTIGATPAGILIVGMPMIVAERGGCAVAAAAPGGFAATAAEAVGATEA
nr:hypothetical protein [Myxococcota bacterium]